MSAADFAERLERLLERERRAILDRRFEALVGLAAEKEALCAQLDAGAHSGTRPALARRLHRAARRNETLLSAVLDGLRAARAAIAAARSGPPAHTTYDAQGRRQPLSVTVGARPPQRR